MLRWARDQLLDELPLLATALHRGITPALQRGELFVKARDKQDPQNGLAMILTARRVIVSGVA